MLDIGLKFYSVPAPYPHPLTDLEVKVTDIEFFSLMKCLYHISQSSESIHIPNRVCFHSITTDRSVHAMGWGYRSIYRTYSSGFGFSFFFFFGQMHFNFIGKARGKLRCPTTALIYFVR